MNYKDKKIRLLEFLLIGLVMGIGEDLLAIFLATDAEINFKVIYVVLIVAFPFAFISELVVDHPRFWEKILPKGSRK
jgi:hypothetical protein